MSDNPVLLVKHDKSTADSIKVKHPLADICFKFVIVGKSELSGKSQLLWNILSRPYNDDDEIGKRLGYNGLFEPEHIYFVCPTAYTDRTHIKGIKTMGIPGKNIMHMYDEETVMQFYENCAANFNKCVELGVDPPRVLIIFDDISFSGDLKSHVNGAISRIVSNGRHIGVSSIFIAQKYTDLSTTIRENATACFFFGCTTKQAELISMDHNYMSSKKEFLELFRKQTRDKHSYLVVRYNDGLDPMNLYFNMNITPILESFN